MIIQPGASVPQFTLTREDGSEFTREHLLGHTSVLVFYPHAFSPVCTDQFQAYDEAREQLETKGATLYGVSTDSRWSQKAFKETLGIAIEQLSDFEPKGETARRFGAYFEPGGMTNRALVIVGPDCVVKWSHLADSLGELPGVNLIFDGLTAT